MDKSERGVSVISESMTGLGRCESVTDEYKISIEMKTVNHRHLDLNIKMPKKFNYFEASVRTLLRKYTRRGKTDLSIDCEDYRSGNMYLKYNWALAAEHMEYFYKMSDELGIQSNAKVPALTEFPKVLTMEQASDNEEHLWKVLSETLKEAAVRFMESREIEGEHLKRDLLGKLDHMETLMDFVEECSSQVLTEYKSRLEDKVKGLLDNIIMEESRIVVEATIYADKIRVDEEAMRLRSHVHNTRNGLLSGESVGRKLNFIAQKTDREANTILPKFTDLSVLDKVIALKTEIERVREQIQGIE